MQSRTLLAVLIAVVCLVLVGAGIAGVVAFHELASMSRNLDDTTAKMDVVATNIERVSKEMQTLERVDRQLSAMNGKLSKTNDLLLRTNASLDTMVGESKAADARLAVMQGDISVMSHKIAGSFLFRGVK
jgi:TolA-binding protein